MAILRATVDFNFSPIQKLIRVFPSINGKLLAFIGKRARVMLKEKFLSGQELNLHVFPRDKAGRPTITSDVNKKRTFTKIYSFPVNLFERGRRLRSGEKEPGKFIITRKLKQAVMAKTGSYISEFETRIFQNEIDKVGL